MKITKNRIKEIILEEMQSGEQLNESSDNIAAIVEQLVAVQAALQSTVDNIAGAIKSLEALSPPDSSSGREKQNYMDTASPFDVLKGRV